MQNSAQNSAQTAQKKENDSLTNVESCQDPKQYHPIQRNVDFMEKNKSFITLQQNCVEQIDK